MTVTKMTPHVLGIVELGDQYIGEEPPVKRVVSSHKRVVEASNAQTSYDYWL
jgi:hypothetical protein